jgi:hypothetical protein
MLLSSSEEKAEELPKTLAKSVPNFNEAKNLLFFFQKNQNSRSFRLKSSV